MTQPLIIRADASHRVGTGHMMRCLALIQGLQSLGGSIIFLSHCKDASILDRLRSTGVRVKQIREPHPDSSDLRLTVETIQDLAGDLPHEVTPWVLLDGYNFDRTYHHAIRNTGAKLIIVDDIAHLSRYEANVIVNQNTYARELNYQVNEDATLLFGADYALLRREFLRWGVTPREISGDAKRLLVTLGGSDPVNFTPVVIRSLDLVEEPKFEVRIIVGSSNPRLDEIEDMIQDSHHDIEVLQNVSNMAEIIAWADVAVASAGTVVWELLHMGLPSILISLSSNQVPVANDLALKRAAIYAGWYGDLDERAISEYLIQLASQPAQRQDMSEIGRGMVDGNGVWRILKSLGMDCGKADI